MVRTILQKYFPDLLAEYRKKNSTSGETACERVIRSVDFVNIYNLNGVAAEQVVRPYIGQRTRYTHTLSTVLELD
jgi:hypothetical protein